MDMQNEQHKDENLEAPPKLVAALRHLSREPVFVPPTLDEALMKAARQHLGRAERKKLGWFRLIPWTVATAGLAAAVFLAYPRAKELLGFAPLTFGRSAKSVQRGSENTAESPIPPKSHAPAYVREDLNGDGKVDILDAFILAKTLQAAPISDPRLDVNGDGVIDRRDIETIAAHAVSLEKKGRS
jgi:Dockerin type I domain